MVFGPLYPGICVRPAQVRSLKAQAMALPADEQFSTW